ERRAVDSGAVHVLDRTWMALRALEQLEDLLAGRPADGIGHVVLHEEGVRRAVEGGEVERQVVELLVAEAEGRHVDLEPRTDLTGLRRPEEGEEPVALDLGALALDDGRRERRVGHQRAERAAEALDDVAALAVVVLHDPAAVLDRGLARVELLDDAGRRV